MAGVLEAGTGRISRLTTRAPAVVDPVADAPWSEGLRGVVRVLALVVVVGNALIPMPQVYTALAEHPASLLPLLVIGLSQVLAVWAVWGSHVGVSVRLAVVGSWILGAGVLSTIVPATQVGVLWWPLQTLYPIAAYLGITARSRREIVAAAVLAVAAPVVLTPDNPLLSSVDELRYGLAGGAQIGASVICCGLALRALRTVTAAADRAGARRREKEIETQKARASTLATESAARYVHDTVLHGLQVIAMDRRDVPSATVVREIRQVRADLDRPALLSVPVERRWAPLAERLRSVAPDDLVVTFDVRPGLQVPHRVANALARSVGEALRNVARHSGAGRAWVSAVTTSSGVEVSVVDHGTGFDAANQQARQRRGISESILERMRAVGGQAVITSAPGQGTRVTLRWGVESSRIGAASWTWQRETIEDLVRTCLLAMLPFTIGALIQAVAVAPYLRRPGLGLLASGTALLAVLWGFRFRRRGMSGTGMVVVIAAGALMTWAAAESADLSGGSTLDAAATGAMGVVVCLVFLFRSRREGFVAAAVVSATWLVVAWRAAPDVPLGVLVPMVAAPLFGMVAGWFAHEGLARVGRDAQLAEAARVQADIAEQLEGETRRRVLGRVAEVSEAVRPLVDGVAEGSLDPSAPEVRAEAAHLEQLLREDLSLGGAPEVRAALRRLRRTGATVTSRCSERPPGWALAQCAAVIGLVADQLDDATGTRVELVVQPAPGAVPAEIDVSVLVTPPAPIDVSGWSVPEVVRYDEPDGTQVLVTLRPGPVR